MGKHILNMIYCGKVEREQIRPFPRIEEVLSEINMNGGMHYLYTFDDTQSKTCEFADYYISDYSCFINAILD